LNDREAETGEYVLYWMQASQREEFNHALEYAIGKANELEKPLVVFFGLTESFPSANERHYYFMLEGLKETRKSLEDRGIKMLVKQGDPADKAIEISKEAALVVVDRGYLKLEKIWREKVIEKIDPPLIRVETDVIVPVEEVSGKEEYAARTIRPKIDRILEKFLTELHKRKLEKSSLDLDFKSLKIEDVESVVDKLGLEGEVEKVESFHGGFSEGEKHLNDFIKNKLNKYPEESNDPSKSYLSNLSPYLHFGQISPLYIALKVRGYGGPGVDDYLEQLIIRRELAINYVHYDENYDSLKGLPDWAKKTLKKHEDDEREYIYSEKDFENSETHDPYWNAAQNEMVKTGKMHGYMRMYWGKKILEWSKNPQKAFETALYLNNKYELDGRDPNGFTGVAWCFGKHDRAWKERPVYGKVRYMSASGLERKFDMDKYVEKVRN